MSTKHALMFQRRDYEVLAPFLPPKNEYVLFLTLSEVQINLYEAYMRDFAKRSQPGKAVALFTDFQELQRIWTHPRSLRFYSDNYAKIQEKKVGLFYFSGFIFKLFCL